MSLRDRDRVLRAVVGAQMRLLVELGRDLTLDLEDRRAHVVDIEQLGRQ
jgi:hypothetical protein